MPERPRVDEKARDVALLLRNADRLVKEGQYAAALEAIAGAREKDPRNPYAIAYEERVKYLMKQKEGGAAAGSHAPASMTKPAPAPAAAQAAAAGKPGAAAPATAAPAARPAAP